MSTCQLRCQLCLFLLREAATHFNFCVDLEHTHPFVVSFSGTFFVQVVIQLDQSHFAHCIGSLTNFFRFLVPVSPQFQSCGKEQTNFLTTFYVCHLARDNDRSLHSLKCSAFYPGSFSKEHLHIGTHDKFTRVTALLYVLHKFDYPNPAMPKDPLEN